MTVSGNIKRSCTCRFKFTQQSNNLDAGHFRNCMEIHNCPWNRIAKIAIAKRRLSSWLQTWQLRSNTVRLQPESPADNGKGGKFRISDIKYLRIRSLWSVSFDRAEPQIGRSRRTKCAEELSFLSEQKPTFVRLCRRSQWASSRFAAFHFWRNFPTMKRCCQIFGRMYSFFGCIGTDFCK